jgi:hypothetical protein
VTFSTKKKNIQTHFYLIDFRIRKTKNKIKKKTPGTVSRVAKSSAIDTQNKTQKNLLSSPKSKVGDRTVWRGKRDWI